MKKQTSKLNRKGIAQFIDYAVGFGVAVVGFVIVIILLQSIVTTGTGASMCLNSSHIYNLTSGQCNLATNVSQVSTGSLAANTTVAGLTFANNFSAQWGLSGTILGYVLVLSILALIGVGGYVAYKKARGSR